MTIRLLLKAHFEKQRDACCALLDVNGVRFLSLPPANKFDEEKINAAVEEFSVRPLKCDGDHAEPKCGDPNCWLGDPPTDPQRPTLQLL